MDRNVSLKRRLWDWWGSRQWLVAGFLALISVILGFIGFRRYFISAGETRSGLDVFYLTVQLFTMNSGAVPGPIGWELEVARLLAPLISAWAAASALGVIFRNEFEQIRLRSLRNHIVIVGLGRKGALLARRFRERGEQVVGIELDRENDQIVECRERGIHVLVGAGASSHVLKKAGVHRARLLLSVCGNDGVNAEVAVRSRELKKEHPHPLLTGLVHIVEPQLCLLLQEQELCGEHTAGFRLEFFNIYDRGARAWMHAFPPFRPLADGWGGRPHLLVIGIGKLGSSLVSQAANQWKLGGEEGKLPVTLIDREAPRKLASLCLGYPRLETICRFTPLPFDINTPEFQRGDFLCTSDGSSMFSAIFLCLDNDAANLAAALSLRQRLPDKRIPIVLRMERDAGLAKLLENTEGRFQRLFPFSLLDRTMEPESLIQGTNEILAQSIHEVHLRSLLEQGDSGAGDPANVPWIDLPKCYQESNRRQADHIRNKLEAAGCTVMALRDPEAEDFQFSPEEIELLAEMEHERWLKEKRRQGWIFAAGPKDPERKTSPFMVPHQELNEETKALNRNVIRQMPLFLAQAGFQINRLRPSDTAVNQPAKV